MKYFHLTGLKQVEQKNYPIDILIGGESLQELKEVLAARGLLIFTLEPWEKPASTFGKYEIIVPYEQKDYSIVTYTDTSEKSIKRIFELGLKPKEAHSYDGSITQESFATTIKNIESKIKKEEQKKRTTEQERKKKQEHIYADKSIQDALKVVNNTIDRIDQLLNLGANLFDYKEKSDLISTSEELKKIRLGNNFQKIVTLLTQSQSLILADEEKIFKELENKKFFIDRNSRVTNIDVIQAYNDVSRAKEKSILKQTCTPKEQIYGLGGPITVFSLFFWKDFLYEFNQSKQNLTLIIANMIEYLLLRTCVIIACMQIFIGVGDAKAELLSYFPIIGRGGLLLFIYNHFHFKQLRAQIVWIIVVIACTIWGYWIIKNTFAF